MIFSRIARIVSRPCYRIPAIPTTGAFISTMINDTQPTFPTRPYHPAHKTWPYQNERDFSRYDESPDTNFYPQHHPRFVAHIDEAAIDRLTTYYSSVVPLSGKVLDLCTSWRSWYADAHAKAVENGTLKTYGIGLNAAELAANPLFSAWPERRKILDLNEKPLDLSEWERLDCVTCTVSIDYLARAVDVLKRVRDATKDGGRIHLAISNRCFPTKAVKIWLDMGTDERLELVGDYLHFSGWKDIEIVDLCATDGKGERLTDDNGTVLPGKSTKGSPSHFDPLWIVRGTTR